MIEAAQRAAALPADACLAAALLAVDPVGLGGITLSAPPGPQRDAWIAFLDHRLPSDTPRRRLPLSITDDRLLGGLDLPATLRAGKPVFQRGILAETDGGILIAAMAERMESGTAARVGAALDTGMVTTARDGFTDIRPARLALVLLDEHVDDEGPPPAALRDRLAFAITLSLGSGDDGRVLFEDLDTAAILAARDRLSTIRTPEDIDIGLCATTVALGVDSARAALFATRAARAAAALDGRETVTDVDAALATRLVLAHRATRMPMEEEDAAPSEPEMPPEPPDSGDDTSDTDEPPKPLDPDVLESILVDAAVAAMPEKLLAQIAGGAPARGLSGGRGGPKRSGGRRGRPVGTRRGEPGPGKRLSILSTLRAAAPWQAVRKKQRGDAPGPRVEVRRDDFRVTRIKQAIETVTIFVVDASGSAALNRLAEAKGAVELLLAECYIRRDEVALITFSGRGVDVALPPTRSLTRAKRGLTGLPGGGGTPLAAAIDAARMLGEATRRHGRRPVLIFLTDGRANITLEGEGNRALAAEQALKSAKALLAVDLPALMVDISPRPRPTAREVADAMGARYLALPHAASSLLADAVSNTGSEAA